MIDTVFKDITRELSGAPSQESHPYRYCTLATIGINQTARIRLVILRDVDEKLNFTFYSDKRTKKVIHIKENKNVSLLFYHPLKQTQIRVEGFAHLVNDPEILKKHWNALPKNAQKAYAAEGIPGTEIEGPDYISYIDDPQFFSIIKVTPLKIDYIQLNKLSKVRIFYSLEDDGKWEGSYLIP